MHLSNSGSGLVLVGDFEHDGARRYSRFGLSQKYISPEAQTVLVFVFVAPWTKGASCEDVKEGNSNLRAPVFVPLAFFSP